MNFLFMCLFFEKDNILLEKNSHILKKIKFL